MIKAQNLSKWFGPKLVVDDVSFTVERGEVLGFLGPNGAGKSTTMRMITGFLPPSSGTVEINGHDMAGDGIAARGAIGYLPENAPLYPEMTVASFLCFVAELNGFTGTKKRDAVNRVVEMCYLQPVFHQTIETLSKGYRHRTCFAQAVLADPPVLVLDEPTDGLDPNQKHEVRNLIKQMGQTKAIIISTHILEEVDAVCSRVIIIDRGKLVFNGKPGELRGRSETAGAVTVSVRDKKGAEIADILKSVDNVGKTFVLQETTHGARVRAIPAKAGEAAVGLASAIARKLQGENLFYNELHTEEGRLEEVFRSITVAETAQEGK